MFMSLRNLPLPCLMCMGNDLGRLRVRPMIRVNDAFLALLIVKNPLNLCRIIRLPLLTKSFCVPTA